MEETTWNVQGNDPKLQNVDAEPSLINQTNPNSISNISDSMGTMNLNKPIDQSNSNAATSSFTPISSFSQQFESLLRSSMTAYKEELERREKLLVEKEKKLNIYFNFEKMHERIISVHVGNTTFKTTSSILCSVPDSYFSFKLVDPDVTELFIPRDPCSFSLVLEYLTYGRVCTLPLTEGLQYKLLQDAKVFFLPDLAQWCEQNHIVPQTIEREVLRQEIEDRFQHLERMVSFTPRFIRLGTGILQGAVWTWGIDVNTQPDNFSLTTHTAANDSVIIREPGVYRIVAQVTACSTANYYASLFVNETEKNRCYASSSGAYFHTFHFYDLQELTAGSRLKITQTGASQGPPVGQACFWFIEKTAERLYPDLVK